MLCKSNASREKLKANYLALLCAIIERELARPPYESSAPYQCPRCGGSNIAKRGHDATGKQRYSCHACKRSFTAATGNFLSSTNIPLDTWFSFAECFADKRTLRDSAERCGISLKTAFYMRKRLDTALSAYVRRIKQVLWM